MRINHQFSEQVVFRKINILTWVGYSYIFLKIYILNDLNDFVIDNLKEVLKYNLIVFQYGNMIKSGYTS